MPTYEYECSQCGVFEEYQDMTDELLTKCPTCGGGVQRLLGAGAAVIVKGGGGCDSGVCKALCGREGPCAERDSRCDGFPCEH